MQAVRPSRVKRHWQRSALDSVERLSFFELRVGRKAERMEMESWMREEKTMIRAAEAVERNPYLNVVILSINNCSELVFKGVVTLFVENSNTFNTIFT